MTTRYTSLTVVLTEDMREDDARPLMDAIGQLKGVAHVAGKPADPADFAVVHRERVRMAGLLSELGRELWEPS